MNRRGPAIKTETIIAALKATDGMVYLAADRVPCSPDAIYVRAKKEPEIQQAIDDARGKMLDTAETSLKRAIINGEGWAVCFALKCLGKKRGYIEQHRYEHTGADGQPLDFSHVPTKDLKHLVDTLGRASHNGDLSGSRNGTGEEV